MINLAFISSYVYVDHNFLLKSNTCMHLPTIFIIIVEDICNRNYRDFNEKNLFRIDDLIILDTVFTLMFWALVLVLKEKMLVV